MMDLSTPAGVEHAIRVIQLSKLCNISALVMYIYEHLITLDEEVNMIWSGGFSPGKLLFVLLRYLTHGELLFLNIVMCLREVSTETFVLSYFRHTILTLTCSVELDVRLAWVRFQWIAGSIVGFLAHLTLELRLYAMYNKDKVLLVLLSIATIAVLGAMFGIFITIMKRERGEFLYISPLAEHNMCFPTDVSQLFQMFWIPILAGEAALVGLAVLKGLRTSNPHGDSWWSERPPYGFLRFLVRDSVLFFVMVSVSFIATELTWVIAGVDYKEVPVGFAIAFSSIWSQRLLINIRRHRTEGVEDLVVTVDSSIPHFANSDIVLDTFRRLEVDRVDLSPRCK